jgi:hypothetical protein
MGYNTINYRDIAFEHVVIFSNEDTLFATARERDTGKARIFLVFSNGRDRVYTRNGVATSWELLDGDASGVVLGSLNAAMRVGIPVYKFNGSSRTVTGEAIPVD